MLTSLCEHLDYPYPLPSAVFFLFIIYNAANVEDAGNEKIKDR